MNYIRDRERRRRKGNGGVSDESAIGGNNCETLECACFYDRSEFRMYAHFDRGEGMVRTQGIDGGAKFLPDLRKRFITCGEIDIRVNY